MKFEDIVSNVFRGSKLSEKQKITSQEKTIIELLKRKAEYVVSDIEDIIDYISIDVELMKTSGVPGYSAINTNMITSVVVEAGGLLPIGEVRDYKGNLDPFIWADVDQWVYICVENKSIPGMTYICIKPSGHITINYGNPTDYDTCIMYYPNTKVIKDMLNDVNGTDIVQIEKILNQ